MKKFLILAAFAAVSCKAPKPPAAEAPAPAAEPAAEVPMDKNRVEKYVSGLQADVKRAQEAKEKADAANKKAQEAEKLPE